MFISYMLEVYCIHRNETKMFVIISSIKLRRFRGNLMCSFLNKFAANSLIILTFPPHLNNVYLISTLVFKFARFESSWLQRVGNTAKESVPNMHHWYRWPENSDWERSGPRWIMSSLQQPFVSSTEDSVSEVLLNTRTIIDYTYRLCVF